MFNLLRVIVALTLIRATERFLYSVRSTCIGRAGWRDGDGKREGRRKRKEEKRKKRGEGRGTREGEGRRQFNKDSVTGRKGERMKEWREGEEE